MANSEIEKDESAGGRVEEAITVALRLFLERGYDNTPMSLLAKELGLTKPGVYHHFESKEHLLFIVHKVAMERRLGPILAKAEKIADPLDRLQFFLSEYAAMMTRDPAAGIMIRESRRLSPEHFEEIRKYWRRQLKLVRNAIIELQQQGRCRGDLNPTFAAFGAIGIASWIFYWFDYSRPESAGEVVRTVVALFMNGLLGAPAPSTPTI